MPDKTLDARGLTCPLPILKAKKAMGEIPVGAILEVLATDPGAEEDFKAFSRTTGHELVSQSEAGGVLTVRLRRTR